MKKTILERSVLLALLGGFFIALFPLLFYLERALFLSSEPFFAPPVTPFQGALQVRHDPYGKGFFGASRNGGRKHKGVDLLSPIGSPVLAAKSGRVLAAGEEKGYGLYIQLLHPDGHQTCYAHLSELGVASGDWVRRGEPIGKSGRSGNAKNGHILPHLHFEIRNDQEPVDPLKGFLDPAIRVTL